MTIKKFSIFTSIIVGIILITSIVLCCVKVDNGLNVAEADKIVIYKQTSSGLELSEEQTPSSYKKASKLVKEMTNLSIMDHMLNGRNIKEIPSQDLEGENGSWLTSNKENNYCVELIFDEKQSVLVSVNGNTKVIDDIYGLIMVVEKTTLGHETAIYFSSSTGSSKSYKTNPILVSAKQNKLYKFIESLEIGD